MKKIFTILTIATISTSAFAQHDLSVSLDNYTNNQVVTGSVGSDGFATDPFNSDFTITNNGPALAAGDTIVIGLTIEGALFSTGLTAGSFNFVTDTVIPTAGTFEVPSAGFFIGFGADVAAGTQRTLCAYASLVDASVFASTTTFDATYNGDATPADNIACVVYELNGTVVDLNVGIGEELEAIANKTYIANNQLIIENNSVDFNSAAIINVINISGQVVATESMLIQKGRNTIELNNLSTGLYVVSIQVEGERTTTKVMVR